MYKCTITQDHVSGSNLINLLFEKTRYSTNHVDGSHEAGDKLSIRVYQDFLAIYIYMYILNIWGIYGKYMGNIQGIYRESIRNAWDIYKKYIWNMYSIYGEHVVNIHVWNLWKYIYIYTYGIYEQHMGNT